MTIENISLGFKLKQIDETRNYFLEEIKENDLISEKYKKVCRALNYFQNFLIFVSTVSDFVLISAFASLVGVPAGITSSAVRLRIGAITSAIKKYNSIINEKRGKNEKIILLEK